MTVAAEEKLYTPEDLLSLSQTKGFELVSGRLVEKGMGAEASAVTIRLSRRIGEFVERHGLGWVLDAECGYQCFPWAPRNVRKPDISVIRRERLQALPRGHVRIAPDLAVEVVSPNDLYSELTVKVDEYLRAGTKRVWVIDPDSRSASVFRADNTVERLHESDALDGEEVLPGFRCPLAEILPGRTTAQPEGETL